MILKTLDLLEYTHLYHLTKTPEFWLNKSVSAFQNQKLFLMRNNNDNFMFVFHFRNSSKAEIFPI